VAHLVLLCFHLRFVGLLLPVHVNSGLNLLLFLLIIIALSGIRFNQLLLLVLLHLHTLNFLLHSLGVTMLKAHHFTCTLFGLFDLFPGPHFLLLK